MTKIPFGWTSLHYAIYHENMSIVKILVIEVTNLELRSFEFETPLRNALFDDNTKSMNC